MDAYKRIHLEIRKRKTKIDMSIIDSVNINITRREKG